MPANSGVGWNRIRPDGRRWACPDAPLEGRLVAALEAGMPDCAGVALGFDRLLMLAQGAEQIDQVIPFAFERA